MTKTAIAIESKYYRQINKAIARLLGSIPDSAQLNNAKYYLTKSKLSNILISCDRY